MTYIPQVVAKQLPGMKLGIEFQEGGFQAPGQKESERGPSLTIPKGSRGLKKEYC